MMYAIPIDIRILNNNSFLTLSKDKSIKLFDLRKEEAIYTIDESKIPLALNYYLNQNQNIIINNHNLIKLNIYYKFPNNNI